MKKAYTEPTIIEIVMFATENVATNTSNVDPTGDMVVDSGAFND